MLNQIQKVKESANAAILGSGRSRRVSTFVASQGLGQGGQSGNWQYTLTDNGQNPDIDAAFGGLDIATTAQVSAVKNGDAWDVTLNMTTHVEDPYDWEDYDVNTGTGGPPPVPRAFTYVGIRSNSDMSALHQYGYAREYLRSGSTECVKHIETT